MGTSFSNANDSAFGQCIINKTYKTNKIMYMKKYADNKDTTTEFYICPHITVPSTNLNDDKEGTIFIEIPIGWKFKIINVEHKYLFGTGNFFNIQAISIGSLNNEHKDTKETKMATFRTLEKGYKIYECHSGLMSLNNNDESTKSIWMMTDNPQDTKYFKEIKSIKIDISKSFFWNIDTLEDDKLYRNILSLSYKRSLNDNEGYYECMGTIYPEHTVVPCDLITEVIE